MSAHEFAISIGSGLGAALATFLSQLIFNRRNVKQLSQVDTQQENRLDQIEARLAVLERVRRN